MSSSNLFQATTDIQCNPVQALQGADAAALDNIVNVADINFTHIDNFIDGDLETNPVFYSEPTNTDVKVVQVFAILHNYLASIYSYNEAITSIVPDYLPEGVECPSTYDIACCHGRSRSQFCKKMNFIVGLRTDAQHGTFRGFTVTDTKYDSTRRKHHVTFDEDGFVNVSRLGDMNRYLRHTNEQERTFVITFLTRFHRNTFQRYHSDLMNWFDSF